jgi:hypothetical protein
MGGWRERKDDQKGVEPRGGIIMLTFTPVGGGTDKKGLEFRAGMGPKAAGRCQPPSGTLPADGR